MDGGPHKRWDRTLGARNAGWEDEVPPTLDESQRKVRTASLLLRWPKYVFLESPSEIMRARPFSLSRKFPGN
eukprot:6139508-Prymnesium_polylepis.1